MIRDARMTGRATIRHGFCSDLTSLMIILEMASQVRVNDERFSD